MRERHWQSSVGMIFLAVALSFLFPTTVQAYTPASDPSFRQPKARFANTPSLSLLEGGSTSARNKKTGSPDVTPRRWNFLGHECYAEVARPTKTTFSPLFGDPKRPEVVLIHGFGCSSFYWRETTKALTSAGYTVHTLDLLGQGKSAKPGRAQDIEYSINLWAQLVEEYTRQYVPKFSNVVLMGNSLGSVVALSAATGDHASSSSTTTLPSRIQGIGMFNCGVGMNSRNLLKDPNLNAIQRVLFTFLFDTLDNLIFDNIPLLTYLLKDFVTRDVLRNALVGLYKCAPDPASRVDDTLVESFYLPAKEEGSVEALNQIYTNDAGKTPMQLHQDHADLLNRTPLHLVWGDVDQVTPVAGPVGQFYLDLVKDPTIPASFSAVQAGHVPFDEIPECNGFMVQWLEDVVLCYEPRKEGAKFPFSPSSFAWPS